MERKLKDYLPGGKFTGVSEERSRYMAAVRGKGNKSTELRLRMALVRSGISGWLLHQKLVAGKPDFYFRQEGVAVFVDGCFWHGCPKCGHIPKTNSAYWEAKIKYNKARDRKVGRVLRQKGIRVARIWEHELKDRQNIPKIVGRLKRMLG